jgi:hypothetical protein
MEFAVALELSGLAAMAVTFGRLAAPKAKPAALGRVTSAKPTSVRSMQVAARAGQLQHTLALLQAGRLDGRGVAQHLDRLPAGEPQVRGPVRTHLACERVYKRIAIKRAGERVLSQPALSAGGGARHRVAAGPGLPWGTPKLGSLRISTQHGTATPPLLRTERTSPPLDYDRRCLHPPFHAKRHSY